MKIESQVSFPKLVITAENLDEVFKLMKLLQYCMLPGSTHDQRELAWMLELHTREHYNMYKGVK